MMVGFLSVDPLQANYAEWSPYNYVLGNPISFTDPTGRGPEDDLLGGTSAKYENEDDEDEPETIIIPDNSKRSKVLDDLAKIYATPIGRT